MRVLLAVAALVVVAGAASGSLEDLEFDSWKLKFGKSYGSEEEESQRKMIWLDNLKLVLQHNLLADQGIKSYRLGMNHFADMSDQEYQAMFTGCLGAFNETETHSAAPHLPQREDADLPDTVDWRSKGYVTEVKNQKHCGSCWAFSATGALEGQMFKKTGKLVSLSEQQLVDCSQKFRNKGCKGGRAYKAFNYTKFSGGLEAEKTYPYEAKDGSCRYNPRNAVATCRGYRLKMNQGEDYLKSVVAAVGPISVGIHASLRSFKLYRSGVYDDPDCNSSRKKNHAVLVVGYGTENGKDYWLVKNSWGTRWGDKGYIKMSRNKNNQCEIATYLAYPVV